jgi:hypothetical protein
VRVVGLEPTILAEPDFESGASTNFTTPARCVPPLRRLVAALYGRPFANASACEWPAGDQVNTCSMSIAPNTGSGPKRLDPRVPGNTMKMNTISPPA